MDMLFVILLVLASFAGSGLIYLAIRAGSHNRAKLQQLATENGWVFSYTPASAGDGSRTVIASEPEGWTLTLYSQSSGNGGGSGTRWSHFDVPRLALPDGLAVLGPDLPPQTAAMAAQAFQGAGAFGLGQKILGRMTGGLGPEAAALQMAGQAGPGTLFVTPNASAALDCVRDAPELAEARAGKNEAQQPIVLRGPFGLRLRHLGLLRKPGEVAVFIALGQALIARLGPDA